MKNILLLLMLFPIVFAPIASAITFEKKIEDPAQEARAHELFRQFRCMVCQSQSLGESDAPLAYDLRAVIRERITLGENNEEITRYLHTRYGDYILFAPPLRIGTALLWFGPFIILLLGGGGLYFTRFKNKQNLDA